MITTVTINPAVDYTVKVDKLSLGEVNRVNFLSKAAAGKGINVSKAVKNLEEKTKALACVGGSTGEYIQQKLRSIGVLTEFNWVETETRINFKVIDDFKQETKINQTGMKLSTKNLKKVHDKIIRESNNSDILVLAGSLPPNTPDGFYQNLITELNSQNTKVFLDTSKQPLNLALKAKPTLIKPNQRELEEIEGKKLSFSEVIMVGKKLINDGIELVVISMGQDGALLITKSGVWQAVPPQIEVKSTVGAGDSMVGALAVAYLNNYPQGKMIQFAVAMSVATILLPGAEVGNLEEVKNWINKVEVKKMEV